MITCPGCKNERIITDSESGEMICSSCGRVISDKLQDIDSEWHSQGRHLRRMIMRSKGLCVENSSILIKC